MNRTKIAATMLSNAQGKNMCLTLINLLFATSVLAENIHMAPSEVGRTVSHGPLTMLEPIKSILGTDKVPRTLKNQMNLHDILVGVNN